MWRVESSQLAALRCPPCRRFTHSLASKFQARADTKDIAVVFVSSDKDQTSFDEYYGNMPCAMLAVPFSARKVKAALGDKYGVGSIPCLVVLDGHGKLITKDGRGEIDSYFGSPPQAATVKQQAKVVPTDRDEASRPPREARRAGDKRVVEGSENATPAKSAAQRQRGDEKAGSSPSQKAKRRRHV